jgi:hypothetical protein
MPITKLSAEQFKPNMFSYVYAPGGVAAITSASPVDTGATYTYTSGATAEKIFVWVSCMFYQATAGAAHVKLVVTGGTLLNNGTTGGEFAYGDTSQTWDRATGAFVIDVPANTACTMKIQAYAESGGTHQFHLGSIYAPTITGFAVGDVS